MNEVYYFAYGSNMDEKRMKLRVKEYKILGKGILKGYKLIFNKPASKGNEEGYANIVQDEEEAVEGIIYEISKSAIKTLDSYEGVPTHYFRKKLSVSYNDQPIKCETYIASKTKERLKPTREYRKHLLKAKDILSEDYFKKLEIIETIE